MEKTLEEQTKKMEEMRDKLQEVEWKAPPHSFLHLPQQFWNRYKNTFLWASSPSVNMAIDEDNFASSILRIRKWWCFMCNFTSWWVHGRIKFTLLPVLFVSCFSCSHQDEIMIIEIDLISVPNKRAFIVLSLFYYDY